MIATQSLETKCSGELEWFKVLSYEEQGKRCRISMF